jgi:hypothetical protein
MDVPVVTDAPPGRLEEMLGHLPTYLRRDPLVQRMYRAIVMEQERIRLAGEAVRDAQLPSRATVENGGMDAWEEVMGIRRSGGTPAERRRTLDAYLLARNVSTSERWRAALERLVGGTQLEVEKVGYTVFMRVPVASGSAGQAQLRGLTERIVPAHLQTAVSFISGFLVDVSHVDEEAI